MLLFLLLAWCGVVCGQIEVFCVATPVRLGGGGGGGGQL